jgi:protoporphyrinogen IX oxidase
MNDENSMDFYVWLKALHIAAAVTWIGGMLVSAFALSISWASNGETDGANRLAALAMVRRWDRTITSPAMFLVWVLGLALAVQGGWFGMWWLTIKLMLVLGLAALHGMLSGTLRRLARAEPPSGPASLRYVPMLTLAGAAAIIILVVTKPL